MADEKSQTALIADLRTRLAEAEEAKRRYERSIPIEHASGPRMANEVLGRLQVARKVAAEDAQLVSQIDSIIKAIEQGNRIFKNGGAALCW
jgi:hypothetical protein